MKYCKRMIVVAFVEIIILTCFAALIASRPKRTVEADLSQWQSRYITFENNTWSVAADELQEKDIDLIYGPYVYIPRGGVYGKGSI